MHFGKQTCELLKTIRVKLAEANGIKYEPHECTHEGDCPGTCPLCDQELQWLDEQLRDKGSRGEQVNYDVLSDKEFDLFYEAIVDIEAPEDQSPAGIPQLMGDITMPIKHEGDDKITCC